MGFASDILAIAFVTRGLALGLPAHVRSLPWESETTPILNGSTFGEWGPFLTRAMDPTGQTAPKPIVT
jgi:hypothetical protein